MSSTLFRQEKEKRGKLDTLVANHEKAAKEHVDAKQEAAMEIMQAQEELKKTKRALKLAAEDLNLMSQSKLGSEKFATAELEVIKERLEQMQNDLTNKEQALHEADISKKNLSDQLTQAQKAIRQAELDLKPAGMLRKEAEGEARKLKLLLENAREKLVSRNL